MKIPAFLSRKRQARANPRYSGIPLVDLIPRESGGADYNRLRLVKAARVVLVVVVAAELLFALSLLNARLSDGRAEERAVQKLSRLESNMEIILELEDDIANVTANSQLYQTDWEELTKQPAGLLTGLAEVFGIGKPDSISLRDVTVGREGEVNILAKTSDQFALTEWQGSLEASPSIYRVLQMKRSDTVTEAPFGFSVRLLVTGGKKVEEN